MRLQIGDFGLQIIYVLLKTFPYMDLQNKNPRN